MNRIGLPATGQQDFLSKCNDVAHRVRAYSASGNRFTWWMNQERDELRNDPAWRQVFEHVAAADSSAAAALVRGGA